MHPACSHSVATEYVFKLPSKLEHGRLGTRCDLERFATDAINCPGTDDRFGAILQEDKVPRLSTISVDFPRLASDRLTNELRHDTALMRRKGAVAVAESQGYRVDAETALVGRAIGFASKLARTIRGDRM